MGTTHPGNIGAAARALATMGLQRLLLARPQASPDHPQARAMAAGASAVLGKAVCYPDLVSALNASQRAYAFTARRRSLSIRRCRFGQQHRNAALRLQALGPWP